MENRYIKDLIKSMTLKEKVGQLNQKLYGWNVYKKTGDKFELTDEFKEHVKWGGGIGAIYGVLRADAWSGISFPNGISKEDSKKVIDMIREYVSNNTRLKIPVLFSEECTHGHQGLNGEMYPCSLGMGSSWNDELVKDVFKEISNEIAVKGVNLALVSSLDVLRDPRWGRAEECYSEDPYLSSKYTEAIVKGVNNKTNEKGVTVVLKHLCAQGEPVGGHNSGAASIGERELREIFLPPVKSGVSSGALGFMAAYNEIDGVPCHINKKLLTDILRDEYKFEGVVMADGCALDRLLLLSGNVELAAKLALEAGVDLSLWDDIYTSIEKAVDSGVLDIKYVDRAVYRILNLKNKLGLFNKEKDIDLKFENSTLNETISKESLILLKNNDDLLPLKKVKKIAVIGPNADNKYNQLGDYTSPQDEKSIITVLEGIKNIVSKDIEVLYEKGCNIRSFIENGINNAASLAAKSDVAIVVLGGSSSRNFKMSFESNGAVVTSYDKFDMNCGENVDLANLDLEKNQVDLIKEIKSTGTKVVTVLIQGRPHSIKDIVKYSDSIICAWYPGSYGGKAIAETIFGLNNPSGKLSVSIPVSSMQLPCYYNGKDSGQKEDYIDMEGEALYHFGFGLSYSKFLYSNLKLSAEKTSIKSMEKGEKLKVTVDLYNDSDFDGFEVVQLYIKDLEASITRRTKELKGFKKVLVKSRSKIQVDFYLTIDDFKIWDINLENKAESGNIKIMVGKNSKDYLERTFELI